MVRAWAAWAAVLVVFSCGPDVSTSQRCEQIREGDFVFTEVMVDPQGADTGNEWVELFNASDQPLEMKGLTLTAGEVADHPLKTHLIRDGVVGPGEYWVMGDVRTSALPSWVHYSYGNGLGSLSSAQGALSLRCGTRVLAQVSYTSAQPQRSRQLDGAEKPSKDRAADLTQFCDSPERHLYSGRNAGSPGAANPVCAEAAHASQCLDAQGNWRAVVAPMRGELILSEVMANPTSAADSEGEWIELLAQGEFDLNELTLHTTKSAIRLQSESCVSVKPGEHVLLARSGDAFVNGELPQPRLTYSGLSLADSTNQRLSISSGDAGIDEIALLPSVPGKAWQLNPSLLNATNNDDPLNFCPAPSRWRADGKGDYGSPGAMNPPCGLADAGVQGSAEWCRDRATEQLRLIRRPQMGALVITEWLSDPGAIPDAQGEFVELLAKEAFDLNGLRLQLGSVVTPIEAEACLTVEAGEYLLWGKKDDPNQNGDLPGLRGLMNGGLTASSTIAIVRPDGGVLDEVTTVEEAAGASVQVAPGFETPEDNDDVQHRCFSPADVRYGPSQIRGTPGRANVDCP